MRITAIIVILALLAQTPGLQIHVVNASTSIELEYMYVDEEVKVLSHIAYLNGTIYATGSTDNYVVIAAYKNGSRLWVQTVSLPGDTEILDFQAAGGILEVIAYSRSTSNTSLWVIRFNPKGELLEKVLFSTIYPRLIPITALRLGDSIYVAGSSYILGQGLNYMVARVSPRGVEWVQEDLGGWGNDTLKCLTTIIGSRLLVAGDNRTTASIIILSQTGGITRHYIISYPNLTITINGCLRLSESQIVLYGALGVLPMVAMAIVKPDLSLNITVRVVSNTTGIVTAASSRGDTIVFYVTSGDETFLILYTLRDSQLNPVTMVNVTSVARGFIALSSALGDSRLVYVGSNGVSAFILSLLVLQAYEGGIPRLPRIPLLDVIGDPRLTVALLTIIIVMVVFIAYNRLKARRLN